MPKAFGLFPLVSSFFELSVFYFSKSGTVSVVCTMHPMLPIIVKITILVQRKPSFKLNKKQKVAPDVTTSLNSTGIQERLKGNICLQGREQFSQKRYIMIIRQLKLC